jgi:tRNA(His) guanylyltransferase
MKDDLGDRMKMYEGQEADRRFMPLRPVVARIDGRSFSSFTRGLKRPYDTRMTTAMVNTTIQLVKETGACMGYTQSDEITLAWYAPDMRSQIWFDGRIAKMTSQLAAQATLHFYRAITELLPEEYAERLPTFDARVWTLPNLIEATNVFVWREWDATKNSVSMAAHEHFSNKELHGKHTGEMKTMMEEKGIIWGDYPTEFKRGTYVQRRRTMTKFSAEEMERLPPKHEARKNPDLEVERSFVSVLDMPVLSKVMNRVNVIFEGAEPQVAGPFSENAVPTCPA